MIRYMIQPQGNSHLLQKMETEKDVTKQLPTNETDIANNVNSINADNIQKVISMTNLDELVKKVAAKDNPNMQLEALQVARKMMTLVEDNTVIVETFIANGILPLLIEFLKNEYDATLQSEAAWALIGLVNGTSAQIDIAINAGILPPLLKLLDSQNLTACENALWALCNIIGDRESTRDCIVNLGIINNLTHLIKIGAPDSLSRTISWTIHNICRTGITPPSVVVIQQLLPLLNTLISLNDTNVLEDAVWAIANLADCGNNIIDMIIETQLTPCLTSLLGHDDDKVKLGALRAVGNIVTGTEIHTEMVLNCNALSYLVNLLHHSNPDIVKEAMWFLSNIVASTKLHIQAVLEAGYFTTVIQNMDSKNLSIQIHSAWSAKNIIACGNNNQVNYLVEIGFLRPFCNLLNSEDENMVHVVMFGIDLLLRNTELNLNEIYSTIKECGGFNKIEELQQSSNIKISQKALDIMELYINRNVSSLRIS